MYVVLLGPAGAGKTHLGRLLADRLGYVFADTEAEWMSKYGTREAFLADKLGALAVQEAELRELEATSSKPVVVESTGLSHEPMLRRFESETTVLYVRVEAPPSLCVSRVQSRPRDRNLTNEPEDVREFNEFWAVEVAPNYAADLSVLNDGSNDEAIIEAIAVLVAHAPQDARPRKTRR